MRPDAYTKAVLTVIAGSLLWLCAMQTGRPLAAQQPPRPLLLGDVKPQPVVVVGWGTVDEQGRASVTMIQDRAGRRSDPNIPVALTSVPAGPLDVRLEYSDKRPLPVGLSRIKPAPETEWEPIRTAAEPDPPRSRPGIR
jgi:hypothetical protein